MSEAWYDITDWAPHREFASLAALASELGRRLRVAVIRRDGIGDVVINIPLVLALGDCPDVESVSYVVAADIVPFFRRSRIDVVPSRMVRNARQLTLRPASPSEAINQLRAFAEGHDTAAGRFDVAIICNWDCDFLRSRAWAAGTGAWLVGHDLSLRPDAAAIFSDVACLERTYENEVLSHPVRDTRPLVHDSRRAEAIADSLGVAIGPAHALGAAFPDLPGAVPGRVVVHCGASDPLRRWPVECWIEYLRRARELGIDDAVLLGGPGDAADNERIATEVGFATNLAGSAGYDALAATVATASLFVGSDSGPSHVASGLGIPSVVISPHHRLADPGHVNSPLRFAASADHVTVLRPPRPRSAECAMHCTAGAPHCIRDVTVHDVLTATEEAFVAHARR